MQTILSQHKKDVINKLSEDFNKGVFQGACGFQPNKADWLDSDPYRRGYLKGVKEKFDKEFSDADLNEDYLHFLAVEGTELERFVYLENLIKKQKPEQVKNYLNYLKTNMAKANQSIKEQWYCWFGESATEAYTATKSFVGG